MDSPYMEFSWLNLAIVLFLAAGVLLGSLPLIGARLLAPRSRAKDLYLPYECGIPPMVRLMSDLVSIIIFTPFSFLPLMSMSSTCFRSPLSIPTARAKKLRRLFFVCLGILVGLNMFIRPHHPHFGLETIPGFWAVFGVAGAILLGRGAKGLAHTVLGKDEDFYDRTN